MEITKTPLRYRFVADYKLCAEKHSPSKDGAQKSVSNYGLKPVAWFLCGAVILGYMPLALARG